MSFPSLPHIFANIYCVFNFSHFGGCVWVSYVVLFAFLLVPMKLNVFLYVFLAIFFARYLFK